MTKKLVLTVTITCGETLCVDMSNSDVCWYLHFEEGQCNLFHKKLKQDKDSDPVRCKECLEAEI
jgi:hypothetical protein